MVGRLLKELCSGAAEHFATLAPLGRVLLQHYSPYFYWHDSIPALYGYEALSFADVMFGESNAPREKEWIQENQDMLRALKDNIATIQNKQKMYADHGQIER